MPVVVITSGSTVTVQSTSNTVTVASQPATSVAAQSVVINGPVFTGDYTITPSSETQVLNTQYKLMNDNVTINPIPSNYGLITWNGSVITVS